MEEKDLTIVDYLRPLIRYRRFIVWFWLIAVITSIIISLLLPKIYSATALIAPPNTAENTAGILSSLGVSGQMGAFAASFLGIPSSADFYIDILNSRIIAETLIDRFNLMQVYKTRYREDTIISLADHTLIKKTKGELIQITVEDKDPNRAAALANAYVDELDKLTRQLGMDNAGRMRVFLEKRIAETKRELQTAEEKLKNFQAEHKMIALDEQTKAMVVGAAELEGQLIAAETELGILRSFATEDNVRVKLVKAKIAELKRQLDKIEGTVPPRTNQQKIQATNRKIQNSFYIPLTQIPDLGLELARLLREVKIQETVFELLTQQYELARVSEAKDTQSIQIVAPAKVPDKKAKPKRILIVITTAVLALGIAIFISYFREYLATLDTENKQQLFTLIQELKGKSGTANGSREINN
ncbi:MAG: Wzz/FepE/Etk N-terminal domain-containing protein [bacterium]|nr:Wzz/FepE/Etk N-terminal domain-containing protein [bacterium]